VKTKLTPKQRIFVEEYLVDLNGSRAHKKVFKSKDTTARTEGSKLLADPNVKRAIEARLAKRIEKTAFKADDVLAQLKQSAIHDIAQLYDVDGNFKSIHDIPPELRICIQGVDADEHIDSNGRVTVTRKIKMVDRLRALELYGKHLKLFTEKLDISGGLTLEQIVMQSIKLEQQERSGS
jgi:phage terminase small subunit